MKTILLVLLPLLVFAQNQLPDTLYLIDGRTAPCLITALDDDRIYFNYDNNRSESLIIPALQKVSVESFGTVFLDGIWQNTDAKKVRTFVGDRLNKINDQRAIDQELQRVKLRLKHIDKSSGQTYEFPEAIISPVDQSQNNKWSFGVLYVPYYSGNIYKVYRNGYNPDDPEIYTFIENLINLEVQLAYGITPALRATFEAGYSSSLSESRLESHQSNSGNSYDQGTISTVGLKLFDFNLGLKYYIKNIMIEKVSVYAALSFGKQIAFAQNEYQELFREPIPGVVDEDNIEEFTEDLNSPWHFNFGFGAEYFFNESLSLNSNIRVLYSSSSGEYNSRYVNNTESSSRVEERSFKNFSTKIGLGLNFYF
ncbi:MAG TPA: hypothetical protein DHV28_15990 [Ignavibacteriales bacterium]|nr:hypothetical protein [Ignavibacteriales bacterium]